MNNSVQCRAVSWLSAFAIPLHNKRADFCNADELCACTIAAALEKLDQAQKSSTSAQTNVKLA